jgi:3-dehydroquinate dehydratase I
MICVSIAEPSVERCVKALKGLDFAEIRMEGMELGIDSIKAIFAQPLSLIATCRPGNLDDGKRKQLLMSAIAAGADYVDIEVESDSRHRKEIIEVARARGCQVIISFHDYEQTPPLERLKQIVSLCFTKGADIAKVACRVRTDRDNARLLGLLDAAGFEKRLIVVGMGEKGKILRIAAPFLGSPFTYASLARERETAEGQIEKDRLEHIIRFIHGI